MDFLCIEKDWSQQNFITVYIGDYDDVLNEAMKGREYTLVELEILD